MILREIIGRVGTRAQPCVHDSVVARRNVVTVGRASRIAHLLEQPSDIDGVFDRAAIACKLLVALVIRVVEELTGACGAGTSVQVTRLVVAGPCSRLRAMSAVGSRGHITVGIVTKFSTSPGPTIDAILVRGTSVTIDFSSPSEC